MIVYNLVWYLGNLFYPLLFRWKVLGRENVPKSGGLILVSNHASYLDPLLVGTASPRRPVCFMARDTLWKVPVMNWMITQMRAMPVKRGGADRQAWRRFEELVAGGEQTCFFPEGTRSPDGRLQAANPGSGMLIHRCKGAVVLPVRVFDSHRVLPKGRGFRGFHQLSVVFGTPLDLSAEMAEESSRDVYARIADKCMAAIATIPPPPGRHLDAEVRPPA